ncbi:hypothetical protein Tco_1008849 [Tanacetum coccineum]
MRDLMCGCESIRVQLSLEMVVLEVMTVLDCQVDLDITLGVLSGESRAQVLFVAGRSALRKEEKMIVSIRLVICVSNFVVKL